MTLHRAESAANKRKPQESSVGAPPPMPKETMVERMRHQQSIGKYAEKMDEFAPGIDVEVAMSKDFRKRPGAERGEDMFLADMETGLTGVFDGLGQGREGG